jgi:hypothetical protein
MSKSTKEAWEDYAKKFNDLSKELTDNGIDPKKLTELVDSVKKLYNR